MYVQFQDRGGNTAVHAEAVTFSMSSSLDHELLLVDLDQEHPGYRQFISCWAYRDARVSLLVDPGPRSTANRLIEELRREGFDRIDLVLLTHIHLDHGGGVAEVLAAFPQARVVCHPKGVQHLLEPGKLWQGSVATIGPIAEMYGRPTAVAATRLADASMPAERGIQVLETPGHAAHHLCFLVGDLLFAGEAIATRLPTASGKPYLRPATPPRFFPGVFLDALDRLAALSPEPARTAFAHYGLVEGCRSWCHMAREQLLQWLEIAREERQRHGPDVPLERLVERLLRTDPCFGQGRFDELDTDIRLRERGYVENSLRGILQHLKETGGP